MPTMRVYHGSESEIERFELGHSSSVGVVAYFSACRDSATAKFGDSLTIADVEVNPLDLRDCCGSVGLSFREWSDALASKGIDMSRFEADHPWVADDELEYHLDPELRYWSFLDTRVGFVGSGSNFAELIRRAGFDSILSEEEGVETYCILDAASIRVVR